MDIRQRARLRANESRRQLGYNQLVPVNIWEILREELVTVIKRPLQSQISAIFMRKHPVTLVVINSARTVGHQNFSAAHEYFHIRYEPEQVSRVCETMKFDPRSVNEREADYFAAYFLVPDEALEFHVEHRLRGRRRRLNLADVIALEQRFKVSHQAMLNRLVDTGYITFEEKEEMAMEGVVENARRWGYDVSLYLQPNESSVLSDLPEKAALALERGLITRGRYEEILLESGYPDLVYGEVEE